MNKLTRLKAEARNSAENHGHRMGRYETTKQRKRLTTEGLTYGVPQAAIAHCIDCGAYVQVNTHPLPNQIEIGGNVYGQQCIQRGE